MKKLLSGVLGFGLTLSALLAQAESPFTVTPRMEVQAGGSVLRVSFSVPTNHVLYAEKLTFRLAEAEVPMPFQLPEPITIKDRFSGKEKKVFAQSFEATHPWPNPRRAI